MSVLRPVLHPAVRFLGLLPALGLSACGGAPPHTEVASSSSAQVARVPIDGEIGAALAGATRTEGERARDVYRHPRETLSFFGLRDDMHVVQLWAPGGYYTAILAPILRDHGHLAVTFFDPKGDPKWWGTEEAIPYVERLDKSPDVYAKVERIAMQRTAFSFGADGSADMVLTFRNVHNWIPDGQADAVFAAAFRVLKPGGTFGVVDHRGAPGMTSKQIDDTGYVGEDAILALATKAGFRLAERSEVNANPKDTKDYPKGVWSLPPTYAEKDVSRAKYAAIGESDRLTLKLVKP